jgi:hypothetical protein
LRAEDTYDLRSMIYDLENRLPRKSSIINHK